MPASISIVEAVGLSSLAAFAWRRLPTGRLARQFPRVSAALAGGLVLWICGVGALALTFPAALHWLTAAMVPGVCVAAWTGRDENGRSRGLPPGSLSLTTSIEALVDREFYRKQAARYGAIFKMAQFHQPVVCIVGLARGHQMLREHQSALGPSTQQFSRYIPGGFLRYM